MVLESGAAPLATVCEKIAEQRGLSLNWRRLKVSRHNPDEHFLNPPLTASSPALLFDEYVDSGQTVRRAMSILKSLGCAVVPRIVCFCWLSQDSELRASLEFACHQGEPGWWERSGAYPYENRIDLIGYYYPDPGTSAGPRSLSPSDSSPTHSAREAADRLIRKVSEHCHDHELLKKLKSSCRDPAIARQLSLAHCSRAQLAQLERNVSGEAPESDLLSQLADMHGPMWSPYPDRMHLEFTESMAKLEPDLAQRTGVLSLEKSYLPAREQFFESLADEFKARARSHRDELFRIVEET